MSRTASKLTNSVRQARESQNADHEAAPDTPETSEAPAEEATEPQPAASAAAPKEPRHEPPRRLMPSRRVWPD
ncbi:MAG: hypothetical protein ACQERG_07465 [Pseudomonadota bacterium]